MGLAGVEGRIGDVKFVPKLLVMTRDGHQVTVEEVLSLVKVEPCKDARIADFTTNIALVLFHGYDMYVVKDGKWEQLWPVTDARQVAEVIVEHMEKP